MAECCWDIRYRIMIIKTRYIKNTIYYFDLLKSIGIFVLGQTVFLISMKFKNYILTGQSKICAALYSDSYLQSLNELAKKH